MVPKPENYPYPLTMNDYQADAAATMIYKWKVIYPALGLASEAGEVCDKIKKVLRDKNGEFTQNDRLDIRLELGDVLWYVSQIASDLDLGLESVAIRNIEKLRVRKENDTLKGSGDNR